MRADAKRRLAIGAIGALGIAGVITAVLTTRSTTSSHTDGQTAKEVFGTFGAFGITDGMRRSQVLARFSTPDEKRNGCWVYRVRGGAFHGIRLLSQIAGIDAVRYCFYDGVVAIIEDHWRPVGGNSPFRQPWIAPLTFGCGGEPCQQAHANG